MASQKSVKPPQHRFHSSSDRRFFDIDSDVTTTKTNTPEARVSGLEKARGHTLYS